MEDQIVSLETAMLLKEKGFNGKSFYHYNKYMDECPIFENSLHLFISCEGGLHTNDHLLSQLQLEEYSENSGYILAPTQSLAQKWLREVHHITFNASPYSDNEEIIYVVTIKVISNKKHVDFNVMMNTSNKAIMFKTYEDAIEAGLKYCLKSI